MGKRDVEDFPFAYLADKKSPNRSVRTEAGARVGGGRPGRRSGSREIEKLLIISVVLTIIFIVLLTAAIIVGTNKKKEDQAKATTITSTQTDGEIQSSSINQVVPNETTTQIAEGSDPTQLSVVLIG